MPTRRRVFVKRLLGGGRGAASRWRCRCRNRPTGFRSGAGLTSVGPRWRQRVNTLMNGMPVSGQTMPDEPVGGWPPSQLPPVGEMERFCCPARRYRHRRPRGGGWRRHHLNTRLLPSKSALKRVQNHLPRLGIRGRHSCGWLPLLSSLDPVPISMGPISSARSRCCSDACGGGGWVTSGRG